ncbi:adenylate cyclase [Hoeflea marina]|uniref:Adenylate cyclase n=1 Tax=Hoeflea marina TaxID=274592 RepID=A0A317PMK0_9HYPH|nr:CYTH and CHAD domain-containing protein [Hoeflea marina]PWW02112.1 adenylate cyclase [Hoeflea marina]
MNEVELKLIVDEARSAQIWPRAVELGLCPELPAPRELDSTYFDTPGHDLKRAGIALRLRHDGPDWVQTVKCGRQLHGGLSRATELECLVPEDRIDIEVIADRRLRKRIRRLVGEAALEPVCRTRMQRMSGHLSLADGSRVELAVDIGRISAGDRSADFREMEIELIEGEAASLFRLAGELLPAGGLRFSRHSKSERGYMLAEQGHIEPPLSPRKAASVPLSPHWPLDRAVLETLRECMEQISVNTVVTCRIEDPEGPHQLRIGLRRLRSLFSVFAPVMTGPDIRALRNEARWLGREVGRLRDSDAVARDVVAPLAGRNREDPGFAALLVAMDVETAERRNALRTVLAGPRTQALLLDLARVIETWGERAPADAERAELLARPVGGFAAKALDRRWRKVRAKSGGLDDPAVEARHELRKELKKLRYTTEFLAPVYRARRVRPFLRHLKRLQAIFGGFMDAETTQSLLTGYELAGNPDLALQRAIGWTIGASQTRAELNWTDARKRWADLEKVKPFWK